MTGYVTGDAGMVAVLLLAWFGYRYHYRKKDREKARLEAGLQEQEKNYRHRTADFSMASVLRHERPKLEKVEEKLASVPQEEKDAGGKGFRYLQAIRQLEQEKAEASGICFQCQVDISPDFMEDVPPEMMTGFFMNLWDNAIEAAQASGWDIPVIRTRVSDQEFAMENSKDQNARPLETKFATTKADASSHGIGTRVIRRIAARRGWVMTYSDLGYLFLTNAAFTEKNPENQGGAEGSPVSEKVSEKSKEKAE